MAIMYYRIVKRIFDVVISGVSILFFGVLMILIHLAIKAETRGNSIFVQRRIGLEDKEFRMYKFRSMVVGTPEVATDRLINSDIYITKVGSFLRKTSLDELPQLFNIFKGDMSIVGPRPALYNQYDLRQMRNELMISTVKPGLTGWAQINGRDDINLEHKIELDRYYLMHKSFLFDVRIILLTVVAVFSRRGAK